MVGVLSIGFVANLLITSVDEKHMEDEAQGADRADVSEHDGTGGGTDTKIRTATEVETKPALLVFAWALVGLPFAYGLVLTLEKAATLFGG